MSKSKIRLVLLTERISAGRTFPAGLTLLAGEVGEGVTPKLVSKAIAAGEVAVYTVGAAKPAPKEPKGGKKPEGDGAPPVEGRIVRVEDGFDPKTVKEGDVVLFSVGGETGTAPVAKLTRKGVKLEIPEVADPWVPFKDILGRVEPEPTAEGGEPGGEGGEARA